MTDPEAIHRALLEWAGSTDPDAICLLQMNTPEVVTLHYLLALIQSLMEKAGTSGVDMGDLGSLRKKVEGILVQAGYGGDPRP